MLIGFSNKFDCAFECTAGNYAGLQRVIAEWARYKALDLIVDEAGGAHFHCNACHISMIPRHRQATAA